MNQDWTHENAKKPSLKDNEGMDICFQQIKNGFPLDRTPKTG